MIGLLVIFPTMFLSLYGIDFASDISNGMNILLKFCGTRVTVQALLLTVYGHDRGKLDCKDDYCMFRYPKEYLEFLDIKQDSMGELLLLLGTIFVVLKLVHFAILKYKCK